MDMKTAERLEIIARYLAVTYSEADFFGNLSELEYFVQDHYRLGELSWNVVSLVAALWDGCDGKWVTGWRYGNLPDGGRASYNGAECEYEAGISLQAVDDGPCTMRNDPTFAAEGRPVVKLKGILLGQCGGDGEPLVCCAVEIS